MEELEHGQEAYEVAYILSRAAEEAPDDIPSPERIVLQRATDRLWVCRVQVLNDDQPYGMTYTLDDGS